MELPVRTVDVAAAARLPLHHGDPFDRLLMGQAITEPFAAVDGRRGAGALQRSGGARVAPCLAEEQRLQAFTFKT